MSEDEKYIAWDASEIHLFLIDEINSISGAPHTSQDAPLRQALYYINSLEQSEASEALQYAVAAITKINVPDGTYPHKKSIKVRVDKNVCDSVDLMFRTAFDPPLKKIQRPYYVKILLTAYYLHLNKRNQELLTLNADETNDSGKRFSVAVELSNMLLNNDPKDHFFINEVIAVIERRALLKKELRIANNE